MVRHDQADLARQTPAGRQVQMALSDSDDDFIKPGAAPPKPVKGRVILYHDLPDIDKPYQELTESGKRSFAQQILKARRNQLKLQL